MPEVSKIKVLIAHSDPLIAAGLAATLRRRRDFEVVGCGPKANAVDSTESLSPSRDVVVADYDSGLRLTAANDPWMDRVMILTQSDSEAKICHALEQGVRGYLLLGCSLEELMDGLRSMHAGGVALGPLVASRIAHRMKQEALTRREEDILGQMMLGLSNKRIASELGVTVGTVKTHVKSILVKLDAASRTEAVAIAQRQGILQEEPRIASSAGESARARRSLEREPASAKFAKSAAEFGARWAPTPGYRPRRREPRFSLQLTAAYSSAIPAKRSATTLGCE